MKKTPSKEVLLAVRVTRAQHKQLLAASAKYGRPVSTIIRDVLFPPVAPKVGGE